MTPGRLTYMFGDKIRFTVEPNIEVAVPSVLYGHLKDTYLFLGWKEKTSFVSRDPFLDVDIPKKTREFMVAYVKTPAPATPDDRQIHQLSQQLNLIMTNDKTVKKEFIVLINGVWVKLLGKLVFPTEENAKAVVKGRFTAEYRDWLARLPEPLKTWVQDEGHRQTFFDYWLKENVQVIPYDRLITVAQQKKHDKTPSET